MNLAPKINLSSQYDFILIQPHDNTQYMYVEVPLYIGSLGFPMQVSFSLVTHGGTVVHDRYLRYLTILGKFLCFIA